ncbi:MAG TPA: class I SAM-dependent methyltransferase [Polyangiaceae bacterium]|nr:class I SAM-dependent methyltransferase [Polyangiaceae bacterium]
MVGKKTLKETNPAVLRQAMLKRLPRRIAGRGQIVFPAVPSLLDHYVHNVNGVFSAHGRLFSAEELGHVRGILQKKLQEGFAASPYAKVIVDYSTDAPPSTALSYTVSHAVVTIADEYDAWVKTRTPPLFGAHPDAKVTEVAASLGEPSRVRVLDVGAGTGRNMLPLAEAGFAVDAVELAPALAAILREEVAKRGLACRILENDILDEALDLSPSSYDLIVLAEVVASHFRNPDHVRQLFEVASRLLAPGGVLLFSVFLSSTGFKPDALARELSEVMWCTIFTRREFDELANGLPFKKVSDESVFEFERANLPESAWPPTGWFAEWTQGQDLFDLPPERAPLELRWLVYRRE